MNLDRTDFLPDPALPAITHLPSTRRAVIAPASMTVSAFMYCNPVTVPASLPNAQAEEIMLANRIKAPVVTDDKTSEPVGILEIFA